MEMYGGVCNFVAVYLCSSDKRHIFADGILRQDGFFDCRLYNCIMVILIRHELRML